LQFPRAITPENAQSVCLFRGRNKIQIRPLRKPN
jgi:hypothetical protein